MRQVFHFGERLEDVFALLLGDTATGVADDELVGVRTAFLEVQPISFPVAVSVSTLSRQLTN